MNLGPSAFVGLVLQLEQEPEEPPPAGDPPTADAGGPYTVIAGNAVILDGTGSSDPDGAALTYEWDLDVDGVTFSVDATGATALLETTAADTGRVIDVALRVTKAAGASSVDTSTVTVQSVEEAIDALISAVEELGAAGELSRAQAAKLTRLLVNVRVGVQRERSVPACKSLDTFILRIDRLATEDTLTEATADELTGDAEAIGSAIGWEAGDGD